MEQRFGTDTNYVVVETEMTFGEEYDYNNSQQMEIVREGHGGDSKLKMIPKQIAAKYSPDIKLFLNKALSIVKEGEQVHGSIDLVLGARKDLKNAIKDAIKAIKTENGLIEVDEEKAEEEKN